MSARLSVDLVDAALDRIDANLDGAEWSCAAGMVLAGLLDRSRGWRWRRGDQQLAVIESSGAYWCVVRGKWTAQAWRFRHADEAEDKLRALLAEVKP